MKQQKGVSITHLFSLKLSEMGNQTDTYNAPIF